MLFRSGCWLCGHDWRAVRAWFDPAYGVQMAVWRCAHCHKVELGPARTA
jgi:hypothetical protein